MHSSSHSATISKPQPTFGAAAQKRTLLIVDDEEGPRQSLRVVFKDEYNLLMANDGVRAIELAKQNRIDVAITDIRMVGMSGVELLEHLKSIDPGIEVIMLTAYETVDTLRLALRLGACDYLNKPFDISTMRKAVSNAMERRSLGEEIRNNGQQLNELQKELQNQKMVEEITRTRGEIYASIIHDINGPLTVISGFIQLMNQRIGSSPKLEGEDLDFLKDRLKTITRQVTNCIEISRRYLSFLRQNSDENPPVGVNHILADLHELLRVHPYVRDNEFVIDRLSDDVTVKINGTDLIQILLNLAVNGFQCSPQKHSVVIDGRFLPNAVDLSRFEDNGEERFLNREGFKNVGPLLAIAVKDTGPGICGDVLPKIFDPYFTTKSASQGTGLGLNVVQRLIKEAKAALHVKTKVGEGTTFTVYLPVAQ
ncbi:hybrid sensor histidine kinase/response regulator [Pedosphaera parvula]|uniref:histidine kinase n=1 Tax=Pedosphaera parvula (strain Ellin514) TaxID=320771 RepID=B9XKX4_PEDPL|nr:hybrid sensor histidine kinase/response regulator [Pedosphaera parvula]EEF59468.1 response regulator receiver sensor signal transduction histidine kinase [Pedosphaera parvula Ellin514]